MSAKKKANKRTGPREARSAETRERIFASALELFRERGFDETTMRDIAAAAGMSLGAAYYYFDSKEAIVHAYYRTVDEEWQRRGRALFASTDDLAERIRGLYHLHFTIVGKDRPLLSALVRRVADPASELAVFARETADVRDASIALWREAIALPQIPENLRDLAALALWAGNLGLMLYYVWDDSPRQTRTKQLIDRAVAALVPMVPLLSLPFAAPAVARLEALLRDAGLAARSG